MQSCKNVTSQLSCFCVLCPHALLTISLLKQGFGKNRLKTVLDTVSSRHSIEPVR